MHRDPSFLLVDDSENDLLLTRAAFKEAGFDRPMQEARNGVDAIAYLNGEGRYSDRHIFPLPSVMLLDLNMPLKNGFDVLDWVRGHPEFRRLAIVVLTASMRTEDVERAYLLGANSYLVKSGTIKEFINMVRCLREWLQYNHFPPLNETVRR